MTHYEVLGVDRTADGEAVRRAYLGLARRHHPDLHSSASPDERRRHAERMAAVNAAWEVLGDASRRRHYDDELDAEAEIAGAGPADLDLGPFDLDPFDVAELDDPSDAAGEALRRPLALVPALLLVLAALLLGAALLLRSAAVAVGAGIVGVAGATSFVLFPFLVMARSRSRP